MKRPFAAISRLAGASEVTFSMTRDTRSPCAWCFAFSCQTPGHHLAQIWISSMVQSVSQRRSYELQAVAFELTHVELSAQNCLVRCAPDLFENLLALCPKRLPYLAGLLRGSSTWCRPGGHHFSIVWESADRKDNRHCRPGPGLRSYFCDDNI